MKNIREASVEDVASVPGMTLTVARAIKDHIAIAATDESKGGQETAALSIFVLS